MHLLERLERLDRIDQLIRLKATGTPTQLARILDISKRRVYQLINEMKEMNAPIYFDREYNSYCYGKEVHFVFGFQKAKTLDK